MWREIRLQYNKENTYLYMAPFKARNRQTNNYFFSPETFKEKLKKYSQSSPNR